MANRFGNDNQNIRTNTHRASGLPTGTTANMDGFLPTHPANGLLQTSTNIFIKANGAVVGMIQSFRVSENRGVNKLNAIGYEGVIQAVPQNTQGGQLDITRIALYNSTIWRALGLTMDGSPYSSVGKKVHTTDFNDDILPQGVENSSVLAFRTLRDQRVPLEIIVQHPTDGNGSPPHEDRYVDCWLSSYNKSYSVGEITVAENVSIRYGDVY